MDTALNIEVFPDLIKMGLVFWQRSTNDVIELSNTQEVVWYGKSHANGGEKSTVGRVVELEGGEVVINKRSTSMFRSQLSAMTQQIAVSDGLLNMPSFATNQFNAVEQRTTGAMSQGGRGMY